MANNSGEQLELDDMHNVNEQTVLQNLNSVPPSHDSIPSIDHSDY